MAPPRSTPGEDSPRSGTILLVEDHAATRAAVATVLGTAFPDCRLLGSDSAEGALDLCASELPRLVIMDIALPKMNGVDAAREIRQRFPQTQVVMLSNHDMQIYRDSAHAAGAAAFVSKRSAATELVPVISALLESAAA